MGRWLEPTEETHIVNELDRLYLIDWIFQNITERQAFIAIEKRRFYKPSCVSFRDTIGLLEDEFYILVKEYRRKYKQNVPIRIVRYR